MNQIFHLVFRHKQSSSPHYLLISIRLFASASLRSGPPFTAHKNHSTNAKKKIEPLYRTVKSGLSSPEFHTSSDRPDHLLHALPLSSNLACSPAPPKANSPANSPLVLISDLPQSSQHKNPVRKTHIFSGLAAFSSSDNFN